MVTPSDLEKLEFDSGRDLEASAIFDREMFADTVRRDEPVVGREDLGKQETCVLP